MTDPERGWPPEAVELLHRAIEQHGGRARWQSLRSISFAPKEVRGLLMWLKGCGRTFPVPKRVEVFPHECITVFSSYPDEQHRGVFERDSVRIERVESGTVVQSSPNHRETFRGWAKNRRWSSLDGLYFFGYALWHYHTFPYSLADARFIRFSRVRHGHHDLEALEVEFPPGVPTHCARQTFYFDEFGRLRRHDYVAEVIGCWARGAHHWSDYKIIQGVPIACERHVQARLGRYVLPLSALRAEFADVSVELRK